MNISNLKINSKTKLAAVILSGTLALTGLTGCEKAGALSGSEFQGAQVITFEDGTKDVSQQLAFCDGDGGVVYYESLITHLTYVTPEILEKHKNSKGSGIVLNIKDEESIEYYLTNDELIKIYNDELTDEEYQAILDRLVKPETKKVRGK